MSGGVKGWADRRLEAWEQTQCRVRGRVREPERGLAWEQEGWTLRQARGHADGRVVKGRKQALGRHMKGEEGELAGMGWRTLRRARGRVWGRATGQADG